jgi:hypothetical protein
MEPVWPFASPLQRHPGILQNADAGRNMEAVVTTAAGPHAVYKARDQLQNRLRTKFECIKE